jgi:aspartyl-tRNA(Asn)/glutamyl-tRNA(Gln) amidotransferase subunit B
VHGAGEEGLTGVDYNRCGRPLIEIVTEPEIGEPEHARRVFERLRGVLVACGVSRGDLESGAMRCDANVSVHRRDEPLGSRIEIKNLNSLRFLRRALAFEIERQRRVLESGEPVPQETRTWDERAHRTRLTRVKEDEPDYRYFPDPDLLPVEITGPMRARASEGMPELPHETADRFVNEWGVSRDEAHRLTLDPALADYYERVARTAGDGRLAAGWVLSELAGRAHAQGRPVGDELVPARALGTLADRVRSGRLSRPAGKQVLDEMIRSGKGPDEIARVRGLERIEDTDELAALCREVVANHPRQVSEYRAGKKAVLGFLIGRVMEASGSRADPKQAGALLRGMLES